MARKTKQKVEETRNAILNVAIQILLARGIAGTHIEDIARGAGLTRGAIYWHFSNKIDLLNTLWEDLVENDDFLFQVRGGIDEFDPLGFLVEQLFLFVKEMPTNAWRRRLFDIFIKEGGLLKHDSSFHFDRKSFHQQRLIDLEILLRAAVDKRQLPASIDTYLGAIAIISHIDGFIPQYQQLSDELKIKIDKSFLINCL
ncbi:MAG: TetR family transcriptional regulator, partial [Desulfobulbus sp.]